MFEIAFAHLATTTNRTDIPTHRGNGTMAITKQAIIDAMRASMASASSSDTPYRHWFLEHCLPDDAAKAIIDLPFAAPSLEGVSGKRELHNATRTYFDADNMERHPVCKAVNEAFQTPELTRDISSFFETNIEDSYLRVEYAQDINGFWLEPHTDLGVKVFTMLLYISPDESHANLGTDIYNADKSHFGRSPFASNAAMVFIPSDNTYHGFEPRPIDGVRKSVIINYVTNDWRAREQLAFPQSPIKPAA